MVGGFRKTSGESVLTLMHNGVLGKLLHSTHALMLGEHSQPQWYSVCQMRNITYWERKHATCTMIVLDVTRYKIFILLTLTALIVSFLLVISKLLYL